MGLIVFPRDCWTLSFCGLCFAVEGTTRRAKIACSARVVPEVSPMVIMSQVYRQTLAKSSDTLVGAHVRIHRCNESFIYLLSPLR